MLFRAEPSDVIGRTLARSTSNDYASGFPDRLCSGTTHLERLIWGGWQLLSLCRVLQEDQGSACVCVVQRVGGMVPEMWNGLAVVTAPVADFGPLDSLSDREIEIAALIGMGMTVKDIAEHVHRSTKTVENHRISIGRKLGITDRLQIALLAYNAGLRPEDSGLKRVRRAG
jgi:DNA-binding CsgD family transcriptional regulator